MSDAEPRRIPLCPSSDGPRVALEKALEWANRTFRTACCPTHAIIGALLLSRQLGVETARLQGVDLDEDAIHHLAQAYSTNFRVDLKTSATHVPAMLEAIATALMFGQQPEQPAPPVVGS